jgi:hypothetical protein
MNKEIFYWEVNDFENFNLTKEGEIIHGQKICIGDVRKYLGKDLKVCPADDRPHFSVCAKVIKEGTKMYDYRKSLRGRCLRYYQLKNVV